MNPSLVATQLAGRSGSSAPAPSRCLSASSCPPSRSSRDSPRTEPSPTSPSAPDLLPRAPRTLEHVIGARSKFANPRPQPHERLRESALSGSAAAPGALEARLTEGDNVTDGNGAVRSSRPSGECRPRMGGPIARMLSAARAGRLYRRGRDRPRRLPLCEQPGRTQTRPSPNRSPSAVATPEPRFRVARSSR